MTTWHIITGEYPPQSGGVSDYTRLIAQALAEVGDEVHIWCPACEEHSRRDVGVVVHALPGLFGPHALSVLNSSLNRFREPCRILVQYVPHAFGWKAMNLPFCLWLRSRRRRDSLWVQFHEVAFPMAQSQSIAQNALGLITGQMASIVARAAERIFVSIPAWECALRTLVPRLNDTTWLPVPSNVPLVNDPSGVKVVRERYASETQFVLGHFGTYGRNITELLLSIVPRVMMEYSNRVMLLLGRGSEAVRERLVTQHPELGERLHATGALALDDVSRHLGACDLMVQPYADGISSRRTSSMASLRHGLPIISTSGHLTEPLWAAKGAVALVPVGDSEAMAAAIRRLENDSGELQRIGVAGRLLYKEQFDISHTVEILKESRRKMISEDLPSIVPGGPLELFQTVAEITSDSN